MISYSSAQFVNFDHHLLESINLAFSKSDFDGNRSENLEDTIGLLRRVILA